MRSDIHPPEVKSKKRSEAMRQVLRREGRKSASHVALGRQTRTAAQLRGAAARRQAARKAVATKGPEELREEARKAAHTRAMREAPQV